MKSKLIPSTLLLIVLIGSSAGCRMPSPATPQPAPQNRSENHWPSFGGELHEMKLDGSHRAFVILPNGGPKFPKGKRPWIWYAPTLVNSKLPGREHEWLFPRFLQAGFAIAGVDVGESYGNPTGRKLFTKFHSQLVKEFDLSPKASLLPQSRGGLMLYNWAVEHPQYVQCIGGIYTVCNIASYPGLDKAAPAYAMTPEKFAAHVARHNPVDRLRPLAKAKVPIFHIHGDADKLVPLEKNSGELVQRYHALDGPAQLVIVPGKGHEVIPEFFHAQALLDFFLLHNDLNVQ